MAGASLQGYLIPSGCQTSPWQGLGWTKSIPSGWQAPTYLLKEVEEEEYGGIGLGDSSGIADGAVVTIDYCAV